MKLQSASTQRSSVYANHTPSNATRPRAAAGAGALRARRRLDGRPRSSRLKIRSAEAMAA